MATTDKFGGKSKRSGEKGGQSQHLAQACGKQVLIVLTLGDYIGRKNNPQENSDLVVRQGLIGRDEVLFGLEVEPIHNSRVSLSTLL